MRRALLYPSTNALVFGVIIALRFYSIIATVNDLQRHEQLLDDVILAFQVLGTILTLVITVPRIRAGQQLKQLTIFEANGRLLSGIVSIIAGALLVVKAQRLKLHWRTTRAIVTLTCASVVLLIDIVRMLAILYERRRLRKLNLAR